MPRHLISIDDLDRAGIERILDRAESFAEVSGREIKKVPALRGRTVVNLFYEASTRTSSSSFELAAKRLCADVVNIRSAGSSVDKGESLKDTVQTLSAYDPAAIVIRSPHAGAAQLVAGWTDAARRQRRRRQARAPDPGAARRVHAAPPASARSTALNIWIVGDVLPLARRPLEHPRLHPDGRRRHRLRAADADARARSRRSAARPRRRSTASRRPTSIYVLRMQHERMQRVLRPLAARVRQPLPDQRQAPAPRPAASCTPGPVNRGVELSAATIDSPQALIGEQVKAGRGGADGGPLRAAGRLPDPGGGGVMSPRRLFHAARPGDDLLIRGAHVLDPRTDLDEPHDILIRNGRDRRAGRARRRCRRPTRSTSSTPPASTCSPASSTRTSTCARPARSTRRTSTPAPRRPPPAATAPWSRCPTPTPDGRQRGGAGLADRARPARGAGAGRLPRLDHPRPGGRGAHRDGRAARPRRASASPTTASPSSRPGCCARRCSTSGCAAASSPCTRRTRRCRRTASCTRGRSRPGSGWPGSRRCRSPR